MTLDGNGVLMKCLSCETTNRLRFDSLERATKCGKCQTALPLPSAPIDVPSAEIFDSVTSASSVPVVVDFWAAWCGPCKMVAPEMEKLAEKYDGAVDVVKVDVDANPRLSQAFNIMSIPTIAFFKPGAQPQGVVGFRPLEQLEQQFGLTEFAAAATTE